MGLRIRERDQARKIKYAQSRAILTKDPLKRVREMRWKNIHADEDFLEKLDTIRTILQSDQRALDLANTIFKDEKFDQSSPYVHDINLIRTILKLL